MHKNDLVHRRNFGCTEEERGNAMEHESGTEEFLGKLALMLIEGEVTSEDIYETILEVSGNDHVIAMTYQGRAIEIAADIRTAVFSFVH